MLGIDAQGRPTIVLSCGGASTIVNTTILAVDFRGRPIQMSISAHCEGSTEVYAGMIDNIFYNALSQASHFDAEINGVRCNYDR